jgi:nicotinamidase-related amidase
LAGLIRRPVAPAPRGLSVVPQVEKSHDAPVMLEIDPARTAVVLLDYQNYNVHPDGYWAKAIPGSAERATPAVARTAEVLASVREAGITVIHVQNAWRDGHPDVNPYTPWQADAKAAGRSTEGTWGIEFVEPLAPIADELVVRKRGVSGFAGTELDRLLHIRDISTLVIAGIVTNFAAEGTARDASDRGYRVIVLADCCESVTDEMHQFAITQILPAIGEVVTAADFRHTLDAQP